MKILLIDDEPFHIRWLAENLQDDGYEIEFARDARTALEAIASKEYRALIIDLNIPIFGPDMAKAEALGQIYALFPGLMVASEARNRGYRHKRVILYSAHKESNVQAVANMLSIQYIVKGDTRQVMREINDVLSYDPESE